MGLALYANGDLEGAQKQLESATHLLESIRRETRNSSEYKLSLFELQSSSYQVLQKVLVCKYIITYKIRFYNFFNVYSGLNRCDDALVTAERGRNRAFVDLLLERQGLNEHKSKSKGSKSDMLGISTLDHLKDIVNRQRAAALYYSIAAGFLYAWLILPTKGEFSINFIMLHF